MLADGRTVKLVGMKVLKPLMDVTLIVKPIYWMHETVLAATLNVRSLLMGMNDSLLLS
jgi:hypothetical protein